MFIHIDIDSFFASAERSVNPKLNNIPIAVGGRSNLEIFNTNRTDIKLMNDNTGTDQSIINPKSPRKSIGISRTFDPIRDTNEIRRRVAIMARHIVYMVIKHQVNPTTYFLKINYEYGTKRKTSRTVDRIFSEKLFKEQLLSMYDAMAHHQLGAIKLTMNVSNFTNEHPKTLSLLDAEEDQKGAVLTKQIQSLRDRFGIDIIKSGVEL